MRQALSIARANLRHSLLPALLLGLLICLLTPMLFGIAALDAQGAAIPLEMGISFIGLALLTPLFASERSPGLLQTVSARKVPYLAVCAGRLLQSLIAMLLLAGGFTFVMHLQGSDAGLALFAGTLCNAVFLGGMGLLFATLTRNIVIGYMVPVAYYALDMMTSLPSGLSLFLMMRGGIPGIKPVMLFAGIAMLLLAFLIKRWQMRR